MPVLKKKKPAPEPTHDFEVGDSVKFLEEGEILKGEVTEIDEAEETAIINVDGDEYSVAFIDINPPTKAKKGAGKAAKVEEEDGEPEEEPVKKSKGKAPAKKGKGSSLASVFNEAEPAAGGGFPLGDWQAILVEAGSARDDKGILKASLKFVGVNDEEVEGKTMTIFSQLIDDEDKAMQGLGYFKADLAKLGHEDLEIENEDDLNDQLVELANEELWVTVRAVKQKDSEYVNLRLQGLMDDQEDKPDVPAY